MRVEGWVGERELDAGVADELKALGDGLSLKPYIRFVPNPLIELWEAGWEGAFPEDVKRAAKLALNRHLRLPREKQSAGRISMLQTVIEGKRPIFLIKGRRPRTRDVNELRRRDHAYRHSFEKRLADLEMRAAGEQPEDEARISSLADSLANDHTLYQMLEFGRKSVLVQGLKKGVAR